MKSPKNHRYKTIGIALAAYQPRPEHLHAQLSSLQTQTWKDWTCVVSFDSSSKVLRDSPEFEKFTADPRFQWRENATRLGVTGNFEAAIREVVGTGVDALACCDQDDVWYPEKLALSVQALERLGPGGLVFCNMNLMDTEGNISSETAWSAERRGVTNCRTMDLLVRNVVAGTGMLLDADLARRFPKIPEKVHFHDRWYPLVASVVGSIRPVPQALYAYRIHHGNLAGLSRYTGLFRRKASAAGPPSLLSKCRAAWADSSSMARELESNGLWLCLFQGIALKSRWDFGVLLAVYGFLRLRKDPALARACFARAVGKAFSLLG